MRRLWAFYRNGTKVETLLRRYPQLAPAKVFDALAFAYDNPEVVDADLRREQEMLKRIGQKLPKRKGGAEQIELPFGRGGPARR